MGPTKRAVSADRQLLNLREYGSEKENRLSRQTTTERMWIKQREHQNQKSISICTMLFQFPYSILQKTSTKP